MENNDFHLNYLYSILGMLGPEHENIDLIIKHSYVPREKENNCLTKITRRPLRTNGMH